MGVSGVQRRFRKRGAPVARTRAQRVNLVHTHVARALARVRPARTELPMPSVAAAPAFSKRARAAPSSCSYRTAAASRFFSATWLAFFRAPHSTTILRPRMVCGYGRE